MFRQIDVIPLSLLLASCGAAPVNRTPHGETEQTKTRGTEVAQERLAGRSSCLLLTDATGTALVRTNDERCAERYRPFSTFKIPNSLIGLEAGRLKDADSIIEWDPKQYPPQDWWPAIWTERVHDLRSAFRYSHVPFYRTLAGQIGYEKLAQQVKDFGYGNQNIAGNLDSFWLDGELAISADEQIAFLQRFYNEQLGVSAHSTAVVKDIFVRDRAGVATLSAKTGTGEAEDGKTLAWLVGYVEQAEAVHYFAFNVSADESASVSPEWRIATVEAVLTAEGLWPAQD